MRIATSALAVILIAAPALARPAADPQLDLDKKVTLTAVDTPLHYVIDGLQRDADVNVVLGPAIDRWGRTVTVRASDVTLATVLDQLQTQLGLERTVWSGAIVLHPKGKGPGAEPAVPEGEGARELGRLITSYDLDQAPFSEALTRLKPKTKAEFEVPARVHAYLRQRGARVSLRLNRVKLGDLLNHLSREAGLTWGLENGKVTFEIADPKERQVALDTLDFTARAAIEEGLDQSAPKVDVEGAVRRLKNPATRPAAVRELARQGRRDASSVLPHVLPLLEDPDAATVDAALQLIGMVGDPQAAPAVLTVFQDTKRPRALRTVAGETLAALKSAETAPALIAALNDPWFRVAETARRALVAIGEPAVGPLTAAYREQVGASKAQEGVIYRGLLILGEIGGADARKLLLEAVKTSRGPRALPIRHHAAIGLGLTGDTEVVEPMIAALEEERDFRVAKYITRSLGWITGVEDLPPEGSRWRTWWLSEGRSRFAPSRSVDEMLEDFGGEVVLPLDDKGLALLETDQERTKRLILQLGSEDEGKRLAAESSLAAMGEGALPALRAALDTGSQLVKQGAARAIARIESGS